MDLYSPQKIGKSVFPIYFIMIIICLLLISSCKKEESVTESASVNIISPVLTATQKVTFMELGSVECIPCKAMVPVMDQIRRELGEQVNVVFHDVWTDEGKPYTKEYQLKVIPTQIFLDSDGHEYYRHEGFFPVEELFPILEMGGVDL
jgi:thioredoxin 1